MFNENYQLTKVLLALLFFLPLPPSCFSEMGLFSVRSFQL